MYLRSEILDAQIRPSPPHTNPTPLLLNKIVRPTPFPSFSKLNPPHISQVACSAQVEHVSILIYLYPPIHQAESIAATESYRPLNLSEAAMVALGPDMEPAMEPPIMSEAALSSAKEKPSNCLSMLPK